MQIRIDLRRNIGFWGGSGISCRYEEERISAKKGLPCERRLGRITAELIRALCCKLAAGNRRRNASNCLSSLRCSTGTLPQHTFADIPTHTVVCACNARKYLATPRLISWSWRTNTFLMTIPNEIINLMAHTKSCATFSIISAWMISIKILKTGYSLKWNTAAEDKSSITIIMIIRKFCAVYIHMSNTSS